MKKIKNILILAGGDGSRFWPLKNKMLWSYLGKPLIKHLTDQLADYGQRLIVVANGENISQIKSALDKKVKVLAQDPGLGGMGGAILSCKDTIKGEVLICNGSDLFSPDVINRLIKKIYLNKGLILVAKKFKNYFPGGYLKFSDGKLEKIVEKPDKSKIPSHLVRMVIDYHSDFSLLIDKLKKIKTVKDDWYEQAINQLIKDQIETDFVEYKDYLFPVKYPWHLIPLTNYFLSRIETNMIDKTASFSKEAIVKTPVFIGKNVKIGDFAKIVGPSYIGDNTVIADHTLVYQSHIGTNCLIGGYSEVTRSYLADGVMLHRNYVGDSVLASYVLLGAQAATANLRFDGKLIRDTQLTKFGAVIGERTKVGINSTLLPGLKIGRKAQIGPGEVVKKDVKDFKFLFK